MKEKSDEELEVRSLRFGGRSRIYERDEVESDEDMENFKSLLLIFLFEGLQIMF